jgi:hypothetical protein
LKALSRADLEIVEGWLDPPVPWGLANQRFHRNRMDKIIAEPKPKRGCHLGGLFSVLFVVHSSP